jgi:hypothetical protein
LRPIPKSEYGFTARYWSLFILISSKKHRLVTLFYWTIYDGAFSAVISYIWQDNMTVLLQACCCVIFLFLYFSDISSGHRFAPWNRQYVILCTIHSLGKVVGYFNKT